MAALKSTHTRVLPFRVALKAALLTTVVVVVPLYAALAWAETGHPVRGALKGLRACHQGLASLGGAGGTPALHWGAPHGADWRKR